MEERIIKMYESGLSVQAIINKMKEEEIKIGRVKIRGIITRAGIEMRGNSGSKELNSEIKDKIASLYIDGLTLKELGEKYNRSPNTIRKILIDKNIDRRTMGEYTDPNLVHDYFENINTEAKAYLLGFIIADGFVIDRSDSNSKTIGIDISTKDIKILELFKKELKTENNFYFREDRGTVSLRVTSVKMAEDLSKYGVVPNKTFISYVPKIKERLVNHLLRGIFDGDGSISHSIQTGRTTSRKGLQIIGTYELVDEFCKIVSESIGIKQLAITSHGNVFVSGWASKNDLIKIYDYFYEDATIYLERKKKVFEEPYII